MNRRQLLVPAPAIAAGIVLAGREAFAQHRCAHPPCNNPPPRPHWHENSITASLREIMTPPLSNVKAKHSIEALTSNEWLSLADQFQSFVNQHAKLGNTHTFDLWVQANQQKLKSQYGSQRIDALMEHGSTYFLGMFADYCKILSDKLTGKDVAPACDPYYPICNCHTNTVLIAATLGLISVFCEVATAGTATIVFFALSDVAVGLIGAAVC